MTEPASVVANFELTVRDYQSAHLHFQLRNRYFWLRYLYLVLTLPLALLLLESPIWAVLLVFVVAVVATPAAAMLLPMVRMRRLKGQLRPQEWRFAERVTWSTSKGHYDMQWNYFSGVVESPDYFTLRGPEAVWVVAKRGFTGAGLATFREMLAANGLTNGFRPTHP